MVSIEILTREEVKEMVKGIIDRKFDYMQACIEKLEVKLLGLDGVVGRLEEDIKEMEKRLKEK